MKKRIATMVTCLAMASLPIVGAARLGAAGPPASQPATAEAGSQETQSQPAKAQSTTAPAPAAKARRRRIRVAHIRLSGPVLESPGAFQLFGRLQPDRTLSGWLRRLSRARKDGAIKAVAIEIDSPRMNWAHAQELADAVERLDSQKPVYVHIASGGALDLIVASAGRQVAMEPAGTLNLTGVGVEMVFFRGTMDLLGIEPQMVQIGRFKGAAEPLTRTQPSAELLQASRWLLDDLYAQLCEQIARQRGLETSQVAEAIDNGPLSAQAARDFGLVDRLIPKADWEQQLEEALTEEDQPVVIQHGYARSKPPSVDFANPLAVLRFLAKGAERQEIKDPTVAIVHADGLITAGHSGEGLFGQPLVGAKTLRRIFQELAEDSRVKAVVFRVDSPGGSALASELIYQSVARCGRVKPVVTSVGQMAASGGYYIAVGGETIVADPSAMIGSIGVVGGKLAISGLLEKLGVTTYSLTRGRHAGMWMTRPWTQEEEQTVRRLARRTYELFVRRVAESRAGRVADMADIVEGRLFTARQAQELGLIDRVGGLREAVAAATEAAGIKRCHFITLPRPRNLLDLLTGEEADASPGAGRPALPGGAEEVLGGLAEVSSGLTKGWVYLLNVARLWERETVLTALPYYVMVHH